MESIKVIRPKWLAELETQINEKLEKEFPKECPKVSDLNLQYEIKQKLDKIADKQLVLTEQLAANYNHNFEVLGDKQNEASRIVTEALRERLTARGLW